MSDDPDYLIRWEHLTEHEKLAVMEALQDDIDLGFLEIWQVSHGFFIKNQAGVYFIESNTKH